MGEPVFERFLEMKGHFVDAVVRDETGDRHQTAIPRRQIGAPPHIVEENFIGDLRQCGSRLAERLSGSGRFFCRGSLLWCLSSLSLASQLLLAKDAKGLAVPAIYLGQTHLQEIHRDAQEALNPGEKAPRAY
jgi:hypothetical protein